MHLIGTGVLSRPFDSMNRNGKRMKLEATCLIEVQQCEIIAKLSKPNVPSKHASGWEFEVSEGADRENIRQQNPVY